MSQDYPNFLLLPLVQFLVNYITRDIKLTKDRNEHVGTHQHVHAKRRTQIKSQKRALEGLKRSPLSATKEKRHPNRKRQGGYQPHIKELSIVHTLVSG